MPKVRFNFNDDDIFDELESEAEAIRTEIQFQDVTSLTKSNFETWVDMVTSKIMSLAAYGGMQDLVDSLREDLAERIREYKSREVKPEPLKIKRAAKKPSTKIKFRYDGPYQFRGKDQESIRRYVRAHSGDQALWLLRKAIANDLRVSPETIWLDQAYLQMIESEE